MSPKDLLEISAISLTKGTTNSERAVRSGKYLGSYVGSDRKFTGHCIGMPTHEPANQFVIYKSKIKSTRGL